MLIVAICMVAHLGLPSQPWTYDDLDHIESARKAHETHWTTVFHRDAKEATRWVLNLYYYIAYPIFNDNPSGYHAVKIPLHILNALLCAYLIQNLFRRPLLSGLTGLLFLINCTHYEAIYKISATGILIGTAAVQISLLFTLRHLKNRQSIYAVGAGIAYILAIFSYESLASALVPMLYLWWRHSGNRRLVLPLTLTISLSSFVLIDTFFYGTVEGKTAFNAFDLGWHIPYNFAFFIGRLFLNSHATPLGWDGPPPFDIFIVSFDITAAIGSIFGIILLLLSSYNSLFRFASIWIVATIFPYIFGINQFYFSRYWYLPAIGSALVIALLLVTICERITKSVRSQYTLLGILLVPIILSSFQKIHTYEGRFLLDAGHFYLSHRKNEEYAISLYERARDKYNIHLPILYYNLALAYAETERYSEALKTVDSLLQQFPAYINGHVLRGNILFQMKEYTSGIQSYAQASKLDNKFFISLHKFAQVFKTSEEYSLALETYGEILDNHPDYEHIRECYLDVSDILFQIGQVDYAINILQQLLDVDPEYEEARKLLESIQTHKEHP